ncbi:hypothetical protein RZG19_004764 [Citrobacter freundii]|nr:hypothetical protein [Citrobacter freundii]EBA1842094.1 hypothetical protein [Salmonella enterica]EFJ5920154.1 hypothetical protein [Escherichia coli]EFS3972224.1 hypothetical protein [Shigella sonnei]EHD8194347.1 hypothetical protein [Salmonella enterica]EIJ8459429.1 hypothetical protein [Salmonella enterica]
MDMNHEKQIQQMIKLADDKEKKQAKKSRSDNLFWLLKTVFALLVVFSVLFTCYKIINGLYATPSNWVLVFTFFAVIAISVCLKGAKS